MSTLTDPPTHDRDGLASSLRGSLTVLAFWSAVALPALYPPVLYVGLEVTGDPSPLLALLGCHLLALVAGRSYGSR